jgi:hypothetical protein
MTKLPLALLITFLAVTQTAAQAESNPDPVQVNWKLGVMPEGGWTVGDRIPLHLTATYPPHLEVILPKLPEKWGAFEVQKQTLAGPVTHADGKQSITRSAIVTLWMPGEYKTPPLDVQFKDAEGLLHKVRVSQLSLTIASVLQEGESGKRDLKPQASMTNPPRWPWFLGGLFLVTAIGAVGWAVHRQWRQRPPATPQKHPGFARFSPREVAFGELDRITALDLPAKGDLEMHYTQMADCVRIFVQSEFQVPAMDLTTDELVVALRHDGIEEGPAQLLRGLLTEADLVKFAKHRPSATTAYLAVAQARYFIHLTTSNESVRGAKTERIIPPDNRLRGSKSGDPGTEVEQP